MKHGFSLTSPLYHVIITNRVNKAFMKGYTTAGVVSSWAFFVFQEGKDAGKRRKAGFNKANFIG